LKSQLSKKEKLIEEQQKEIEELKKENEVNQIKWFSMRTFNNIY